MAERKQNKKLLYIEDSLHIDKDLFVAVRESVCDDYMGKKITAKAISLMGKTSGKNLEVLKKEIRLADIIVFDYGGLCQAALMGGGAAAIDYWNRFFVKMIESFSSKDWRCISAINTFDEVDKKELEDLGVSFKY